MVSVRRSSGLVARRGRRDSEVGQIRYCRVDVGHDREREARAGHAGRRWAPSCPVPTGSGRRNAAPGPVGVWPRSSAVKDVFVRTTDQDAQVGQIGIDVQPAVPGSLHAVDVVAVTPHRARATTRSRTSTPEFPALRSRPHRKPEHRRGFRRVGSRSTRAVLDRPNQVLAGLSSVQGASASIDVGQGEAPADHGRRHLRHRSPTLQRQLESAPAADGRLRSSRPPGCAGQPDRGRGRWSGAARTSVPGASR